MKLLLHICCAPCSTEAIERLCQEHDVTGFFFNPNIHPTEEYEARLRELEKFSKVRGFEFYRGQQGSGRWFEKTRGFEKAPEGGERCRICYAIRLEETARLAAKRGFDAFTTTLSISPHKDAKIINEIGMAVEKRFGVKFLMADFKKKNGFKKSVELSKAHGLSRQDYCGCVYSQKDKRN
jgi:predicted adenine nucleotide alpha hydrolase (AANH) superfamily ATPase